MKTWWHVWLRNGVARLLCFTVAWMTVLPTTAHAGSAANSSEEALRAANPNAQVIHISEAEYPQLAQRLQQQGYRPVDTAKPLVVAQNSSYGANSYGDEGTTREEPRYDRQRCDERTPPAEEGEVSGSVQINVGGGHGGHGGYGGGGSGNDAAVLFVIIGAVVVVVWTLYLFKYLYDISVGYQPCRWSEMGFVSSAISTDPLQHAYFSGITFQTGVQDGVTEFGLGGEVGNADIRLVDNGILQLTGLYWLLGPTLRWRFSPSDNPHYFQMQFMAGSTENPEMGVLAKAELALHLALGDRLNLGLSWGALNINLHENEGIITNRDQYFYLYGISAGYRF